MKLIHKNPECRDIAIWYDEFLTPGESFADNIQRALEDSKLFALLVTPNILEEPEGRPNYIMAEEYPAAKKAGKFILPVAMEQTDRSALLEKYQEIPDCIDPADESAFKEQLLAAILKTATTTHNDQPEHNFLIGLAYLEGIDVETDQERGISMITAVAEAELPEAMDYLYRIYANKKFADDDSSESNEEQALLWAKRRVTYYTKQYGQANPVTLRALIDLAESYFNVIEMSGESYEDYDDVFDYRSDAFLQEAIEHARTTYTLCLKVWGEEHTDSIDALHELGALLETVGDWIRSSEILQESYKLREKEYALCQKVYGSHWQTDRARAHLINICLQTEHFERRLELMEAGYSFDEVNKWANCDLALAYGDAGRHQEELAMFDKICATDFDAHIAITNIQEHMIFSPVGRERAKTLVEMEYDIRCRFYGEEDSETLDTLRRLAFLYDSCGEIRNAITSFEKFSLQCNQPSVCAYPEVHLQLAEIYYDLGYYKKAIAMSAKYYALQCKEKDDGLLEQKALQLNAKVYASIGNYPKALKLQQKAYDLVREYFGENDPKTWMAQSNLADIYCMLGNYATAMDLHNDLYPRLCDAYSPKDLNALEALNVLARIHRGMGSYQEAVEIQEKAYVLLRDNWGEQHRHTLRAAIELANTYTLLGEFEKAEPMASLACSAWREMLGTDHANFRSSGNLLAYIYFKTGNLGKALETKENVLVSRCKSADTQSMDRMMSLSNLAYDYRKINDTAAELTHDTQVYTLLRDTMGEDHPDTMSARCSLAYSCFICGDYQGSYDHFHDLSEQYRARFVEKNYIITNALEQLVGFFSESTGTSNTQSFGECAEVLRWML